MRTIAKRFFALLTLAVIWPGYGLADGGADFKARCAACHGSKGAGDTKLGQHLNVRDLGSAEVQKQSDAELGTIIARGKGRMPGYEGKFSKDQIGGIVKFIRTLRK